MNVRILPKPHDRGVSRLVLRYLFKKSVGSGARVYLSSIIPQKSEQEGVIIAARSPR